MENGDSLLIPGLPRIANQESFIVPKPGSANIYYVFTVDQWMGELYNHPGLYYGEVSLLYNGGLGKVVKKRTKLADSTSNQITALYHQNGKDVWILIHINNTHKFYAFLVWNSGVSNTPVISEIEKSDAIKYSGQFKGSPEGNKVALSFYNYNENYDIEYGFELIEFDPATGSLSNPLTFNSDQGSDALEFSSDATKLYIDEVYGVFQYDLISNDSAKIRDSKTFIFYPVLMGLSDMQLAPDGKIYITKGGGGSMYGFEYLGLINYPNEKGTLCDGKEMGLDVNGEYLRFGTIPNYVQNYFYKTGFSYSGSCYKDSSAFLISNINGLDSVKWCFGDNSYSRLINPKHLYNSPGNYIVNLIVYNAGNTDSIQKRVIIHELPETYLGSDTTLCSGSKIMLTGEYDSILWNDNSILNFIIPTQSGEYWVRTRNKYNCQNSDTINLIVNPSPSVDIGNDTAICDNSTLEIMANDSFPNSTLSWNDHSDGPSIVVSQAGTYWLRVENEYSCATVDEIQVGPLPAPQVNFGRDTTLNAFNSLSLDAGVGSYQTYYQWDDHSMNRFKYINGSTESLGSQTISVQVTASNGCKSGDTIIVTIIQDFRALSACYGKPTSFHIGNTTGINSVTWNFGDGSTSHELNPVHLFVTPQDYTVTLLANYPAGTETLVKTISIIESPDVSLGEDITIDYNSILTLDAGQYDNEVYYKWDDDSRGQYRYVSGNILGSGSHEIFVDVITSLNNCKSSDTIVVTIGLNTMISDPNGTNEITIFPNPVEDFLTIETTAEKPLIMEISSIDGRLVAKYRIDENKKVIDFSGYKQGVYIIDFFDGTKTLSRVKLIKD